MSHGIVDVVAFQEALLIEAAFGIALLTMIWVGFRRWLRHKERLGSLVAEQAAERAEEDRVARQAVEARLNALEQLVIESRAQPDKPIAAPPMKAASRRREPFTR